MSAVPANFDMADVATVTHDGKVIVVGTNRDGLLFYTIRQSGFEDSAVTPTAQLSMPGFEQWKLVPLGKAASDASVHAYESLNLVDKTGSPITRSVYAAAATRSLPARVKILSCLDHLYIFRISDNHRLLMSRFILDGMANELVPKLEVRFHRSEQRLVPEGGIAGSGATDLDTLAYRNTYQKPFFEPAQELTFLGVFDPAKPWFSVEIMPTIEHGKHRWNFFVYSRDDQHGIPALRLVSVAASAEGLVDPTDQQKIQQDPDKADKRVTKTIPGIIYRTLEIDGEVAQGFDSTLYHNQVSRKTKGGDEMQLLKEDTRVMLVVPVLPAADASDSDNVPVMTALSFSVGAFGLLSQIDRSGQSTLLAGSAKEVLLPSTDLDEIKLIADRTPPPKGHILELGESTNGSVQVTSLTSGRSQTKLQAGQNVKLWGTRTYDGSYVAKNVDEEAGTFEIEAVFTEAQTTQGHWEVIEDKSAGLAFENMIASYLPADDGKLKVTCVSHNLSEGDEIRIEGTQRYDGVFPITRVGEDNSFIIEQPWPSGEVVNLSIRPRRGLSFDGVGDYLLTDPVDAEALDSGERVQRALSAWIYLHKISGELQTVFSSESDIINLSVDRRGRLGLSTRFADGHRTKLSDRDVLPVDRWIHVAAQVDYRGDTTGETTLTLLKNGAVHMRSEVMPLKPLHLPLENLRLNNVGMPIKSTQYGMPETQQITLEAWVSPIGAGRGVIASWRQSGSFELAVTGPRSKRVAQWSANGTVIEGTTLLKNEQWYHLAATYDPESGIARLYVNAIEDAVGDAPAASTQSLLSTKDAQALQAQFSLGALGAGVTESNASGHNAVLVVLDGGESYRQTALNIWEKFDTRGQKTGDKFHTIPNDLDLVRLKRIEGTGADSMLFSISGNMISESSQNVETESGKWFDVDDTIVADINRFAWHHDGNIAEFERMSQSRWKLTLDDGWFETYDEYHRSQDSLWLNYSSTNSDDGLAVMREMSAAFSAGDDAGALSMARFLGDDFAEAVQVQQQEILAADALSRRALLTRLFEENPRLDRNPHNPSGMHGRWAQVNFTRKQFMLKDVDTGSVESIHYAEREDPTPTNVNRVYRNAEHYWDLRTPTRREWVERGPDGVVGGVYFEIARTDTQMELRQQRSIFRIVLDTSDKSWTRIDDDVHQQTDVNLKAYSLEVELQSFERFSGFLADVRVWDNARSLDEIFVTSKVALTGAEMGLVAFWPLQRTRASQASDLTRNKAHLDLRELAAPQLSEQASSVDEIWLGTPHRAPGKLAQYQGNAFTERYALAAHMIDGVRYGLEFDGGTEPFVANNLNDDLSQGYSVVFRARWDTGYAWCVEIGLGESSTDSLRLGNAAGSHIALSDSSQTLEIAHASEAWVYVAATVAADGTATLYIDTEQSAIGSFSPVAQLRAHRLSVVAMAAQFEGFQGGISDLHFWSRALSYKEVKRYMHRSPIGTEESLLHHWSMRTESSGGRLRAIDNGGAKPRHGKLHSSVEISAYRTQAEGSLSALTEFNGRLSEVELWNVNPSPETVRSSMHLQLQGNERGLIHYWRCSGILSDPEPGKSRTLTADLAQATSERSADAMVYGDVFMSATELARRNSIGLAVRFGNDDLIAVVQGASYRETFEFQATAFNQRYWTLDDLNSADGAGNKLFTVSYWGQRSRTSEQRTSFSDSSFEQDDFVDIGDGWFRLTARFTVPDDINLIRCFEIDELKGLANGDDLPEEEWATISVRRHRIEMISGAISATHYTDDLKHLVRQEDNSAEFEKLIRGLPALERTQASVRAEIADLNEKLKAASLKPQMKAELDEKENVKSSFSERLAKEDAKVLAFQRDVFNYVVCLQSRASWKFLKNNIGSASSVKAVNGHIASSVGAAQGYIIEPIGQSTYTVRQWDDNKYLAMRDRTVTTTHSEERRALGISFLWKVEPHVYTTSETFDNEVILADTKAEGAGWNLLNHGSDIYSFGNEFHVAVLEASGSSALSGNDYSGDDKQRFQLLPKGDNRPEWYPERLEQQKKSGNQLRGWLAQTQSRIDWLVEVLALSDDNLNSMRRRVQDLAAILNGLNNDIDTTSSKYLDARWQGSDGSMALIAEDPAGLKTYGSQLSYSSPSTAVTTAATAEGNVQVSYFDTQGRMRFTQYDAASDDVNSSYEQWLGSSARLCANVALPQASLKLTNSIALHAAGHTVEVWFYFPPPVQTAGADEQATAQGFATNGQPYPLTFLVSDTAGEESALAIAEGRRIGTVVDGFFHDAGVDLERTLDRGWHHVAVTTQADATSFFLDGKPVGHQKRGQVAPSRFALTVPAGGLVARNIQGMDINQSMTIQAWTQFNEPGTGRGAELFSCFSEKFGVTVSRGRLDEIVITTRDDVGVTRVLRNLRVQKWFHVAVALLNKIAVIYINGVELHRTELRISERIPNKTSINIRPRTNVVYSKVSDVQLWNRRLSIEEIREFMFDAPEFDAEGLVAHWPMSVKEVQGEVTLHNLTKQETGRQSNLSPVIAGTSLRDASVQLRATIRNPLAWLGNKAGGGAPAGKIAHFRCWSVALDVEEIKVNSLLTLTGNEPDLLACVPMESFVGDDLKRTPGLTELGGAQLLNGQVFPCSASIGNPGARVAEFKSLDRKLSGLMMPSVQLESSFTIEFWLKPDHEVIGHEACVDSSGLSIGLETGMGLTVVLRDIGIGIRHKLGTSGVGRWVHIACVYDGVGGRVSLYIDGVISRSISDRSWVPPESTLFVGARSFLGQSAFYGQMAEFRVWGVARSVEQIAHYFNRRVTGDELDLQIALPLHDEFGADDIVNLVKEGRSPEYVKTPLRSVRTDDLPIVAGQSLVSAEYSTVGNNPVVDGARRAMLRRFYSFADASGHVALLPGKRIEELVLKWIGNAQFEPTLLGYIEGAPPVPSENLTIDYDYDGATSVELMTSDEVEYSWNRSTDIGGGLDLNVFAGGAWGVSAGIAVETKVSEGHVGIRGTANTDWKREASSNIRMRSTHTSRDQLELRGSFETEAMFPHLGNRFVPKNVGYALVVSGMADVFITQMKRTGRMVAYEVKPAEDMPPDVNTITFLINPAYTLNGSLDGQIGSHAADQRFYRHVPAMRAQHGSRYSASYFNLKQAYALKNRIERMDKDRESYFAAFESEKVMGLGDGLLDQIPAAGDADSGGLADLANQDTTSTPNAEGAERSDSDRAQEGKQELRKRFEKDKEKQEAESKKRVADIETRFSNSDKKTEATSAFKSWQRKMEDLQLKAGKRNIQNTYVWDADGGVRFEEESFANTIEHTVGGSFNLNASLGLDVNAQFGSFKGELSAMATLSMSQTLSKSRSSTSSFELNVRLDRVERKGITDSKDYPVFPGEKVDRYRFMSFYLEGDTDHFHEFFKDVVDPEWLMSNDEEARALRQIALGKPNKTWRVLHRVTYVERPALMGFGRDIRVDDSLEEATQEVFDYFDALEQDNQELRGQISALAAQMKQIGDQISGMARGQSNPAVPSPSVPAQIPEDHPIPDDIAPNPVVPDTQDILDSLNTANLEQLEALNGVGPALAAAIIDFRVARDGFRDVDELIEISGIGPSLLEHLRPQLAQLGE